MGARCEADRGENLHRIDDFTQRIHEMAESEPYLDPLTGARLDILKTPNGWVKPKYEEARSHPPAGDPTWMWTFDAPVSPNRYQKVGFPTKLAAAQGCYAFVAAMRAGVEELEFTK